MAGLVMPTTMVNGLVNDARLGCWWLVNDLLVIVLVKDGWFMLSAGDC